MNINNYMSVKEAAYRWGVKVPALREKLNIKRRPALQDNLDQGLVKYFKSDENAYGEWIISKKAMEEWYGPEPNANKFDENYDKYFRLLQRKIGLDDELARKLLKHFKAEFIINMAFDVFLKRATRNESYHQKIMGLTNSEELLFEIFKYTVEDEIAFRQEEVADTIFDGDYADFYPEMGLRGTKGLVYIKKPFDNKIIEKMKEIARKCQLSLTNSKDELDKYLEY